MTEPQFFKSSYSSNGGSCVEVATNLVPTQSLVPVRDSKHLAGPALAVPAGAFAAFVSGVKTGEITD
ncbi:MULTISPECIES: DUF397 domain-containing protein [unclassified Streptomyces]|uniref:DUF397 domain-containing protein n=1 Tax=unclassified Streptomyces TaxID=2593676 RepID=UPI000CD583D8|nr:MULTISPECIES: DUF397 domain-containing protein [unclassified Streptomyces]